MIEPLGTSELASRSSQCRDGWVRKRASSASTSAARFTLRPGMSAKRASRGQLGAADQLAQPAVLPVVAAADDDVAVRGREGLVRGQVGVLVAPAARNRAAGEIAGDLVGAEVDHGVEQRHIDMLAHARGMAAFDGRQDADGGVQAGQHVGHRDGRFHRPAARLVVALARDAHQPALALEDEVVAGQVCIGAILPVARDRAIDQARVELAQVGVGQAVARQVAHLVVLHQHVALQRQLAHQRLALGRGDIDGDGPLVAIGGGEIGGIPDALAVVVLDPRRPQWRVSSPSTGRSTLITSAPRSASICVHHGPASTRVRSRTRTWERDPDIGPAFVEMAFIFTNSVYYSI